MTIFFLLPLRNFIFSSDPAIPITRQFLIFAIDPTRYPVAPAAPVTQTVSPERRETGSNDLVFLFVSFFCCLFTLLFLFSFCLGRWYFFFYRRSFLPLSSPLFSFLS